MEIQDENISGFEFLFWMCVAVPLTLALEAWVLTRLWAWFIVRTFDVATIGLAQAYGIALIGRFVLSNSKPSKQKIWSMIWYSLGGACLAYMIGWIVQHWV